MASLSYISLATAKSQDQPGFERWGKKTPALAFIVLALPSSLWRILPASSGSRLFLSRFGERIRRGIKMSLYWFAFGKRKRGERKAPEDERRGEKKQSQLWPFGKTSLTMVHR